jgi:hypothetical protein
MMEESDRRRAATPSPITDWQLSRWPGAVGPGMARPRDYHGPAMNPAACRGVAVT